MQVQGSAADLIKVAMVNIQRRLKEEKRERGCCFRFTMSWCSKCRRRGGRYLPAGPGGDDRRLVDRLKVPLGVDLGVGPNWLDVAWSAKSILGLIGGIGSGKSLVAQEFAKRGGYLISGDSLGMRPWRKSDIKQEL